MIFETAGRETLAGKKGFKNLKAMHQATGLA
jgi:hypothetical protein